MRGNRLSAAWLVALPMLAACTPESPQVAIQVAELCPAGGALVANVFGSLEGRLEWRGDELECEGMPRPRGQGARLRFEGPALAGSDAERLAFIIALPKLARGQTGTELEAGVTLILEDTGRFYSSPEQAGCWADIEGHEPAAKSGGPGRSNEYRISGLLYCLSPLAELNGTASVSLRDLEFSGRLDWTDPP
ncbi:MAG: hypothetical protein WDZ50_07670 [Woeseia sp.]